MRAGRCWRQAGQWEAATERRRKLPVQKDDIPTNLEGEGWGEAQGQPADNSPRPSRKALGRWESRTLRGRQRPAQRGRGEPESGDELPLIRPGGEAFTGGWSMGRKEKEPGGRGKHKRGWGKEAEEE